MWVIAELIERRAGQPFQAFVRERIADPLGLADLHVGLPDSEQGRAALCEHAGEAMTDQDWRDLGLPPPPVTEVTEDAILSFNRPEVRAVGVPGGGAFMSAAELALFYQALLHGGLSGKRIWSDAMLKEARRVRTGELTDLAGTVANRGLGIIVAGDERRSFRGFGKTNSPGGVRPQRRRWPAGLGGPRYRAVAGLLHPHPRPPHHSPRPARGGDFQHRRPVRNP